MILQKERAYRAQMMPITNLLGECAAAKGWTFLHRGRHAHACISGPVGGFHGTIDIQMVLVNWDEMPPSLPPDYPFEFWSSAGFDGPMGRHFYRFQLFWQMPFSDLKRYTPLFLDQAWRMLANLSPEDFSTTPPSPSSKPDLKPHFGGPQTRW